MKKVTFGVFADMHPQLTYRAEERLGEVLEAFRQADVDFIIHLGDFCQKPAPEDAELFRYTQNDAMIAMFSQFEKPHYHVVGNHDMDFCKKEELLRYWGVDKNYYSFDCGGYHFAVLDLNYMKDGDGFKHYESFLHPNRFPDVSKRGEVYPCISREELEWLREDLAKTPYPTILFSHQYIPPAPDSMLNYQELRPVIEGAPNGVVLAISGHEHIDHAEKIGNTWYYGMNSMNQQWVGTSDRRFDRPGLFGEEADKQFPDLKCTIPYEKPLYAILTLDDKGATVKGVQGGFVGPSPEDMKLNEDFPYYATLAELGLFTTSCVKDRYFPFF